MTCLKNFFLLVWLGFFYSGSVIATHLITESPKFATEFQYKIFFSELEHPKQLTLDHLNSTFKEKLEKFLYINKNSGNLGKDVELRQKILFFQKFFPISDRDSDIRFKIQYGLLYFFILGFKYHKETFLPIYNQKLTNDFWTTYLSIGKLNFSSFMIDPKISLKMKNEYVQSVKVNPSALFIYKASLRGILKKSLSSNALNLVISGRCALENYLNTEIGLKTKINKTRKIFTDKTIDNALKDCYSFLKNNLDNFSNSFSFDIGVQYYDWYFMVTKKYKNLDIFKTYSTKFSLSKEIFFSYFAAAIFSESDNIKEKNNLKWGMKINLGLSI